MLQFVFFCLDGFCAVTIPIAPIVMEILLLFFEEKKAKDWKE